ncbi:carotenoid 1,2-hydratase [Nitrospirales bacterium NOB]|nr:carotenoid 1,2-hydratase [Nitrospira sp. NTP2]MDL1888764.1 carotenoid 1,2-hydratase [Nitrospirales bacterium NOB]QOJ37155.1 MAG: carotenoid 1,2-hydratase [Nitrospira sp.]RIK59159.1 MAG: carotenoid 1,2-hydratase [Nitrospira sp.]
MRLFPLLALLLSCSAVSSVDVGAADGGPAESPISFQRALPGYQYHFPYDHGAHEAFRTEWWYYTGHLTDASGRRFGFQLTFFRRGIPPEQVKTLPSAWSIQQLYLAHVAVTDLSSGRFHYADKLSRGGLGKAGADSGRLHVWIDRWSLSMDDQHRQLLQADTEDFGLDLQVTPLKPPVVHGNQGISRKGGDPSEASHYYSFTRLRTEGRLRQGSETVTVTGIGWMDHEFGSADLGRDIVGWDWFSLHFNDDRELMWYALRRADGSTDPASSGTLVFPDGRTQPINAGDLLITPEAYWTSPRSKARYPQRWRLRAPSLDLDLEVRSLLDDQELDTARSTRVTYWEGAVSAAGQAGGRAVTGQGYVELTGYAKRFTQRL